MHYLAAILVLATTVFASEDTARLFSGTYEECFLDTWTDELYAKASSAKDMAAIHWFNSACWEDQPTGDEKRQFVWISEMQTEVFDGDSYCLVMYPDGDCDDPEGPTECDAATTMEVTIFREW